MQRVIVDCGSGEAHWETLSATEEVEVERERAVATTAREQREQRLNAETTALQQYLTSTTTDPVLVALIRRVLGASAD